MYFNKKNFTFGLGTGVILISLVFYCINNFLVEPHMKSFPVDQIPDEVIIARAIELGMTLNNESPVNNKPLEIPPSKNDSPEIGISSTDNLSITESPPPLFMITIPDEFGAEAMAEVLYEQGLIDDQETFAQYLLDNGVTTLSGGTFQFPERHLSYEMIVEILQKP